MNLTTKTEAKAVQRDLHNLHNWPLESLARLASLYSDRGDKVLAGLVREEIRARQQAASVLPLGERTLFE